MMMMMKLYFSEKNYFLPWEVMENFSISSSCSEKLISLLLPLWKGSCSLYLSIIEANETKVKVYCISLPQQNAKNCSPPSFQLE